MFRLNDHTWRTRRNLHTSLAILLLATVSSQTATAQSGSDLARLKAVPFNQVQINDSFWTPRRETNRLVSIPHNLDMLVKAGNIRNFELAAAHEHTGYSGPVFMDSDLYKGMEAASYSLATNPDPALDKRLDGIIEKIAAAQQPDGYLNTHFLVVAPDQRWKNLRDWHELYCAGHLFEAAAAHYQATGKRSLLNIATKYADYIDSVFGNAPGKRMGYPGHPEIELALVKLWRVTGEKRYFELARFFIENRGRKFFAEEHKTPLDKYDGTYWQDDVPIYDHKNIKGHAVRAAYLLSGTVDVAAETGDARLLQMVHRVWRNTAEKNMYLTGGIGPSASNEGFTEDYDLPNMTAYQETCASVAMAMWNHRLALLYGEARYADLVERSLYNGVLDGVSLDGTKFFYVNPLASTGNHHRSDWFGCACCPPNVARTLSSLGGYAYATSPDTLWVNLYIQGSVKAEVAGHKIDLAVKTDYPWDGKITLTPGVEANLKFALKLRIPGWCDEFKATVDGKQIKAPIVQKGYLIIDREWRKGDAVVLNLSMPVRRIQANPAVREDAGLLAIQRGPLVYCVEESDQQEKLDSIALPVSAELKPEKRPGLLGGVVVLTGMAQARPDTDWHGALYKSMPAPKQTPITAIPYYAWDNRTACPMKVWLPVTAPPALMSSIERQATVAISFKNSNCQPEGVCDGIDPKKSSDQTQATCHWWPHKGTTEWVQYSWKKPVTLNGTKVFWFDDTGRGECKIPAGWRVLYRDGENWKPVEITGQYDVKLDQWCQTGFKPVTTTALRLEATLQPNWASGIQEWRVLGEDLE